MATAFVDVPPLVKTLLSSNWTTGNVDGATPKFYVVNDNADANHALVHDLGFTTDDDLIKIYEVDNISTSMGLTDTTKRVSSFITLDVRSAQGRAHHIKLKQEIDRILDATVKNPFSGFQVQEGERKWPDQSGPTGQMLLYRASCTVEFKILSVARGS